MTLRSWVLALALTAVGAGAPTALSATAGAPNVVASSYDVSLSVLPDGSVDVVETISLAAGPKSITWFERRVPSRRTDGVVNAEAWLDGAPAPSLVGGRGARIRERNGLDVRWEFPATANNTRVFQLRYRAMHALARELGGWRLRWQALPIDRSYPIQQARVTLRAPDGALASALSAEGGEVQPATSWQEGLVVIGREMTESRGITLDVTFAATTLRPIESIWAVREEHAQRLAPAFLAGAFALLVVGAGTLMMVRISLTRPVAEASTSMANRGDAAAALAATLLARGHVPRAALHAAVFQLLQHGHLVLTRCPAGRGAAAFTVTRGAAGAVAGHEQWIIDSVSTDGDDLARWQQRLLRQWPPFRARVIAELTAHGWHDAERRETVSSLRQAGWALVVLGVVSALVLAGWLAPIFGPALLFLPAALVIDGVAFVVGASGVPVLSATGEVESARWHRRVLDLRRIMTSPAETDAVGVFSQWLPLAVGAGCARPWVKAFGAALRRDGADLAWMRAMGSPDDAMATMMAVVAAAGASHAGGSAGVSGAAGGGSSSAG